MRVFAIEITENTLPIVTLLNKGISPLVEGGWTWFLFEMNDDDTIDVREIMKYSDFTEKYGSRGSYRKIDIFDITQSARKGL